MRLQVTLSLFLAATQVDPALGAYKILPRGVTDALKNGHDVAKKHSAGLARDLRVALGGVLATRDLNTPENTVYCKTGSLNGNSANSGQIPNVNGSIPVGGPGGNSTRIPPKTTSTKSPGPGETPTPGAPSPWKLLESHEGMNFLDGFDFFNHDDPTNGKVAYQTKEGAESSNLVQVTPEGVTMRVETTPNVSDKRKSVRITTRSQFTGGLVIMDSSHMPSGCSVWPAFWTNGPNWPSGGEIDIVEGVSDYTNNQATIHTDPGCRLPSTSSDVVGISGTIIASTDCAAASTGNQGCGVRQKESNSFGAAFNANGGGVYVMKWDDSGVSTYFFPRDAIPSDITSGQPTPATWGLPAARWPAEQCAPFQFFKNHSVIINTTLCGDWAAGVWNSAGIPGQEQSCAARTGFATCEEYVKSNGASFTEAYWTIKSVKIYQLK